MLQDNMAAIIEATASEGKTPLWEDFRRKISHVEDEVAVVTSQVAELRKANGNLKGNHLALEEKVNVLTCEVNDMNRSLKRFQSEQAIIERKIEDLEQTCYEREVSEGMNLLSELCWQIQSLIYRKVLPNSYDDKECYKVKYIEEDIDALDNEQERSLAAQVWAKLKMELNWETKQFNRTIKSIQEPRIYTTYPKLTEDLLLQSATQMSNAGMYGTKTFESVKKLISVWRKLVEIQ